MIKEAYVAFDLETTGLSEETDSIIEIGAVKVTDGKVTDRFMEFLKPGGRNIADDSADHRDHERDGGACEKYERSH